MRSSCHFTIRVSADCLYKLIWPCLIGLLCIDCGQAFALPYRLDNKPADQAFHINIEEIQIDSKSSVWVEPTSVVYDEDRVGWRLAPYPVHMDGALYYALIFEEQSILVSQVQVNVSIVPRSESLPIPECPTLFLMGIGLLGVAAYIRGETVRKVGRLF